MRMMRMMMMRRRRRRPRRSRSLIDNDNIWKAQDGNDQPDGGDDGFTKFVSGGDGGLVNADREKSCSKVASISPKCTQPDCPGHAMPCNSGAQATAKVASIGSKCRQAIVHWVQLCHTTAAAHSSQVKVASISPHWPTHPRPGHATSTEAEQEFWCSDHFCWGIISDTQYIQL